MKIKLYIIFTLLLVIVTSCEVTNVEPEDKITDLSYWKSVDDLELFANSFYTTLSAPDANLDNTSDIAVPKTPDTRLFNNMTVPGSGGGWGTSDWTNIRNLNYFLSHYQTVEGNDADINQYVGEILFFRANEYFNKVRIFGDVPWMDKDLNVDDVDLLNKARDPRKLVIEKIIEDLDSAVADLNLPEIVAPGRLHKFAALQLLARVCLYEGTWMKYRNLSGWEDYLQKAVDASERIMNEGNYEIVAGNAQYMYNGYPLYYRQQFIEEDLTANKECVLPRIYIQDLLMHGLSRNVNESNKGVSKDFIESFLCVDGEAIGISPLYLGDDSVQMEMTNRDPRLRNMIDNKNLPYYLDGSTPISYPVTPVVVNTCPTGYMVSKYRTPEPAQNEANKCTYDWYIFRYAEVLLIFAEAKTELGSITQIDIDNSINKLRARLDEPGNFTMGRLTMNPQADPMATVNGRPRYGYEVTPLIYEIRRERCIELAFEGFRWDDICRWHAGILIENPKTMLGIVVNNDIINRYMLYNGGTDQFATRTLYELTDWDGNTKDLLQVYSNMTRIWDDKLYLNPLPTDQLTLNPNLVQNPGWE
jgi:starch-binding outer membrane protein, SusD/RagB family